jgi:putative transcriptional regulator
MLVASPQMNDPFFAGTVVLLCQHDDDGAMGIVVNRTTTLSVGTVIESLEIEADHHENDDVMWGGPVEPGAGFVIYRGDAADDEGWQLGDEVAVSPSIERLERMLQQDDVPFYLCLGYAGWGPRQLDVEIEDGSWVFCDLDPELLFVTPANDRYDRALASLGVDPRLVWMRPVNE